MQATLTHPPYTLVQKHHLGDHYLTWLGWVLLGYAVLGRGFAYLGIAPLYVGEVTMLAGILVLAATSNFSLVWRLPLVKVLVAFMVWELACTLPYLPTYGLDALRDAVLWGYGCFALIVAGLLIQQPYRLRALLIRYRRFIPVFAALVWLALLLKNYGGLPKVPGTTIPIVQVKNGDALVHIAGVGAFIIVGMARAHPAILGLLMLAFIQGNRAGMLACVIGILIAIMMTPFKAKMAQLIYVMSCVVVALILFMPTLTIGKTTFSMEEVWTKAESIFVSSEVNNYNSTKTWRLEWWGKIIDYTVFGPYFWTGKGYGVNLSVEDGFLSGAGEKLRSPHNSHMSVLARSGVPGFLFWLILHVGWLWGMIHHYLHSRRTGDAAWAGVFTFLIVYYTALMINAGFDVVLEGPMGGIWMWTLFGIGLAAMHLHTYHPDAITLT